MSILVSCECGKQMQVADELGGRLAQCPDCGRQLVIPMGDEPSPYAPPSEKPAAAGDFAEWPPGETKTNGKAITSLVLGLASIPCSATILFGLALGIPAIIFGCLGLGEIGRGMGRLRGKGMAITGIVTGALSCSLIPIAVMIALLLPAVQAAREAARRAQCVNNLKQIALAFHNYHQTENHFPMAAITDAEGKPLLSWRVALLPYIDQKPLYEKFHLDEPWDSPNNKPLLAQMPAIYACPSEVDSVPKTLTHYEVFVGPGALFENGKPVAMEDIKDGTSNTLMVVEAKNPVPWTQPEDLTFAPGQPLPAVGSRHPGGFNAMFADGAVRFLKYTLNPEVFQSMITRNGGEVITNDSL